jgi:hypothetical protein
MASETVFYLGKEYNVIFVYDSGYCEIKRSEYSFDSVHLVHLSELTEKNVSLPDPKSS